MSWKAARRVIEFSPSRQEIYASTSFAKNSIGVSEMSRVSKTAHALAAVGTIAIVAAIASAGSAIAAQGAESGYCMTQASSVHYIVNSDGLIAGVCTTYSCPSAVAPPAHASATTRNTFSVANASYRVCIDPLRSTAPPSAQQIAAP